MTIHINNSWVGIFYSFFFFLCLKESTQNWLRTCVCVWMFVVVIITNDSPLQSLIQQILSNSVSLRVSHKTTQQYSSEDSANFRAKRCCWLLLTHKNWRKNPQVHHSYLHVPLKCLLFIITCAAAAASQSQWDGRKDDDDDVCWRWWRWEAF